MSRLARVVLAAVALGFVVFGAQLVSAAAERGTDTVAFCPGPRGCHS